jgi:hypothetical protein
LKGGRNRKGEGQKGGNREMREGEGMKVEGEDRSCFHKVTISTEYSTVLAVSTLPHHVVRTHRNLGEGGGG